MMRSLYSGVSGLQNHQVRMDVIGNNISNVNTTGFKKGRVTFQDMLSQMLSGAAKPAEEIGGVNPKQVGLGMVIAAIDTIHTQGSLQTTGKNLDLAIQGEGFFVLNQGDKSFYTRNGAFSLDEKGTLVNPANGLKVQGWSSELIGGTYQINTAANIGDIQIPLYSKDPARQTQNIWVKCNLFSETGIIPDYNTATETDRIQNTHESSIEVYDSRGNSIPARFIFYKTDVNTWRARLVVEGADPAFTRIDIGAQNVAAGAANANELVFQFDNFGRPLSVTDASGETVNAGQLNATLTFQVPGAAGGLEQTFNVLLGEAGQVDSRDPEGNNFGVTQFASAFTTKPFKQDGFGLGYLEAFKVDNSGVITGVYSNGNNRPLARIAMANFTNVGGLEKAGENNYVASNNSGLPDIGPANFAGKGKITAGALEMSNVDLAEQFTDMIVTQRGFQANSKTIQTSDQMLQELMTLKR